MASERTTRAALAALVIVAVLAVLAVVRATYDDGPTPAERRCTELRASANAVAGREDTVDDELEYLRRAKAADQACTSAPLVEPARPPRPTAARVGRHLPPRGGRG